MYRFRRKTGTSNSVPFNFRWVLAIPAGFGLSSEYQPKVPVRAKKIYIYIYKRKMKIEKENIRDGNDFSGLFGIFRLRFTFLGTPQTCLPRRCSYLGLAYFFHAVADFETSFSFSQPTFICLYDQAYRELIHFQTYNRDRFRSIWRMQHRWSDRIQRLRANGNTSFNSNKIGTCASRLECLEPYVLVFLHGVEASCSLCQTFGHKLFQSANPLFQCSINPSLSCGVELLEQECFGIHLTGRPPNANS